MEHERIKSRKIILINFLKLKEKEEEEEEEEREREG